MSLPQKPQKISLLQREMEKKEYKDNFIFYELKEKSNA